MLIYILIVGSYLRNTSGLLFIKDYILFDLYLYIYTLLIAIIIHNILLSNYAHVFLELSKF